MEPTPDLRRNSGSLSEADKLYKNTFPMCLWTSGLPDLPLVAVSDGLLDKAKGLEEAPAPSCSWNPPPEKEAIDAFKKRF